MMADAAGTPPPPGYERGVIIEADGRRFPMTVDEAWTLRSYLPLDAEPEWGPAHAAGAVLELLVQAADELVPDPPPIRLHRAEEGAIARAVNAWLDDVTVKGFPPRMVALRYGLYVADVNEVEFRPVLLRYRDGREEYHRDVLVTGTGFEFGGRQWIPGSWIAERDESGAIAYWLVCGESG